MYSKYSLFLQGHLPGCIYYTTRRPVGGWPLQGSESLSIQRWHCETYPLAVKDSYYLIQSPTLILDGFLKTRTISPWGSRILPLRNSAHPDRCLTTGRWHLNSPLLLWRCMCFISKWTRSNKQETWVFLASRSVLNYSDGCACWVWYISWGMRSYLFEVREAGIENRR